MCINYINERVRQFSTNRLITDELHWYKMECIEVPQVDFLDNKNVIGESLYFFSNYFNLLKSFFLLVDLMDEIFVVLDDESKQRFPSANNFVKLLMTCPNKKSFNLKIENSVQCFVIQHFSKKVCYSSVSTIHFHIKLHCLIVLTISNLFYFIP